MRYFQTPWRALWRCYKLAQNAHLLRVNSAFSPIYALPENTSGILQVPLSSKHLS